LRKSQPPLGQLLVEKQIITPGQLQTALKSQEETGEFLGSTLIKLGYVDEESILFPILSDQLGVEFAALRNLEIGQDVISRIPVKFATHYQIIPIHFEDDTLTVASAHPLDIHMIDGISLVVSSKIKTVLASSKEISDTLRRYYGVGAETLDQMMDSVTVEHADDGGVENIDLADSEASIGKFINQILKEAYKDRSTDIHIEPYETELKVRYRVDGILYDAQVPGNVWHFREAINSRIKIMSNLNIAEKRLPQDGRFKVRIGEIDLDLRVSFLPTQHGESVVIRILSSVKLYNLEELGLTGSHGTRLKQLLQKSHGIIFVTGPTGSGKTTTLYACLAAMNTIEKKIITIEDPIEYQLKGVTQIQINPAIELSFARGLRSMLRHDPDIMMVGEVRDLETAEIAVQIALTGHLVFSTLHTNDAASGMTRLIEMGVEPYLVASAVECFIAQRLVRVVCPRCREKKSFTNEMLKEIPDSFQGKCSEGYYEGKGCKHCNETGFFGREAIYEFLFLDESVKELVLGRASADQIKNLAVSRGMTTMVNDGWQKVLAGRTTPGEVFRVTQEDQT